MFKLKAKRIGQVVKGSPFQPGDIVRVIDAIDKESTDVSKFIGRFGKVVYLEYNCGCGQTFPNDPMIGVKFKNRKQEFWKEELKLISGR